MLKKSTHGRIINISSSAHTIRTEEFDDIVAPQNYGFLSKAY